MESTAAVTSDMVVCRNSACGAKLRADTLLCEACGDLRWPEGPLGPRAERVRLNLDLREAGIRAAIADAYRDAALGGADMTLATESLERCRQALLRSGQPYDLWDVLDNEVGRAETPGLGDSLQKLRAWFEKRLRESQRALLAQLAQSEAALYRKGWLMAYAEAMTRLRYSAAEALTGEAGELAGVPVPLLRNLHELAAQERWTETLPAWTYLAGLEDLPVGTRAQLRTTLAQVLLYNLEDETQAWQLLLESYRMDPGDSRAVSTLGDALSRKGRSQAAARLAARARELAPDSTDGYVLAGDLADQDGDSAEAEKWFLEAVRHCPGYTTGYERLMNLLGRRDGFAEAESRVLRYAEQEKLVEPACAYRVEVSLGDIYLQAGRRDEARQHYETARDMLPARAKAYTALGLWNVAGEMYPQAEECFGEALARAPESPEVLEALLYLYDTQEQWQKAIDLAERHGAACEVASFRTVPYVANALWHVGRRDEAKALLLDQLRKTPEHAHTNSKLEAFAEEYYKKSEPEAAEALFTSMHEFRSARHPGELAGHLGEMYYYLDKYEEARKQYAAAVELDAGVAAYHTGLGDSLRQLLDFTGARQAYDRAYALDKKEHAWRRSLAQVANDEGIVAFRKADYRAAGERFAKALENDPKNAVMWANLGDAWEHRMPEEGEAAAAEADAALRKALTFRPKDESYRARSRRLEARRTLARLLGPEGFRAQPYAAAAAIEAGAALAPFFEPGKERDEAQAFLNRALYRNYGVWGLVVEVRPGDAEPAGYRILFRGTPVVTWTHDPDRRLVTGDAEELAALAVPSEPGENPANGVPARWVGVEDARKIGDGTVTVGSSVMAWDIAGYAYLHLFGFLRRNLEYVLELDALERMLAGDGSKPCRTLADDDDTLLDFLHVTRVLLSEDVPVVALKSIAEQFQKSWRPDVPLWPLVEEIRSLPEVRTALPGVDASYRLLAISQRLEDLLAARVFDSDTEPFLAMEPEFCQQVLGEVREQVKRVESAVAVVVRDVKLRGLVRRLVRLEFPYLFVVAQGELETGWESRVIETIDYEGELPPLVLERVQPGSAGASAEVAAPEGASEMLGAWLEVLGETRPRLVKLACSRFTIPQLAAAVECLARSGVPVADLALVLDGLLSVRSVLGYAVGSVIVFPAGLGIASQHAVRGVEDLSMAERGESARQGMARVISHRYAPDGNLKCLLLDPEIERIVADPARLADPEVRGRIVRAIREEWGWLEEPGCVLLTSTEVRLKLEEVLRGQCDALAVLAYQDLSPELNVTPLARVSW